MISIWYLEIAQMLRRCIVGKLTNLGQAKALLDATGRFICISFQTGHQPSNNASAAYKAGRLRSSHASLRGD
jgi:hypothetical protein